MYQERRTVTRALLIFAAAVLIIVAACWACVRLLYRRDISRLKEQVSLWKSASGAKLAEPYSRRFMNREALVTCLRSQTQRSSVCLFHFPRFPKTRQHLVELLSAFTEAGWAPACCDADPQPFIRQKGGKYLDGIWVVGANTEIVASALLEAEIENVHIDPEPVLDMTAIVIGG